MCGTTEDGGIGMGSLGSQETPGRTALSRVCGSFVSCPIVVSPFQRHTCAGQSIGLEEMACTAHFRLLQPSELQLSRELDKNHSYPMGRSRKMTMSWPFLQKVWEQKLGYHDQGAKRKYLGPSRE